MRVSKLATPDMLTNTKVVLSTFIYTKIVVVEYYTYKIVKISDV